MGADFGGKSRALAPRNEPALAESGIQLRDLDHGALCTATNCTTESGVFVNLPAHWPILLCTQPSHFLYNSLQKKLNFKKN